MLSGNFGSGYAILDCYRRSVTDSVSVGETLCSNPGGRNSLMFRRKASSGKKQPGPTRWYKAAKRIRIHR